MISESMKFKVYCIQEFSRVHDITAPETVDLFEKYDVYSLLDHTALRWQSLENTVLDIDEFISSRS